MIGKDLSSFAYYMLICISICIQFHIDIRDSSLAVEATAIQEQTPMTKSLLEVFLHIYVHRI